MINIQRLFTVEGHNVFDTVKWIKVNSMIKDKKGEIIFELKDAEFPDFYSQNSIDIIASKFFLIGRETSLKHLINRVVRTITDWGIEQSYFSEKDSNIFYDELSYMILHQMFSFNSPTYFNVGNDKSDPQVSACFILSAEDNLENIVENMVSEAKIFSRGSGAGSNRSKIRSSRELISNGGKPSGPCNFMSIYDRVAKVIKSGGITRRAAKMESLNIDHGDIHQFIWQKAKEEEKAKALINAGYPSSYEDPDSAYNTVNYQSSNQSIGIFCNFMKAYQKKESWALLERYPSKHSDLIHSNFSNNKLEVVNISQGTFVKFNDESYLKINNDYYKVIEWVSASSLLSDIAECAWISGDPGLQFLDIINKWHTCKNDGEIRSSNPCGEYLFLDDTSCNLASLNLVKFFDSELESEDDILERFDHGIRVGVTAMDIVISKASYPTEKISSKTKLYRTIGLGYSNLGALLMRKGISYSSSEALYFTGGITSFMTGVAYNQSSIIASHLESFPQYKHNKKSMRDVIALHQAEILKQINRVDISNFELSKSLYQRAYSNLKFSLQGSKGYRNAQVTVIAPTGTISFMMGCETTGPEPVLSLVSYKTLSGGGFLTLTSPSVSIALRRLGYTNIEEIESYINDNNSIIGAPKVKEEDYPIFLTAIGKDNNLSPMSHLYMMKSIQPFISGAISKTINLPNSYTKEDILNLYIAAWEMGLKSITVYRDGCKLSQPVSSKKEDNSIKAVEQIKNVPKREKMPSKRHGITQKFKIGGHSGFLTVNNFPDGRIGEILITLGKQGGTVSGFADWGAILFSIALQYGVPLDVLLKSSRNTSFAPNGITDNSEVRFATSVPDFIAKFLEKTVKDQEETQVKIDEKVSTTSSEKVSEKLEFDGRTCPVCGNLTVITGTCSGCPTCGFSAGCS